MCHGTSVAKARNHFSAKRAHSYVVISLSRLLSGHRSAVIRTLTTTLQGAKNMPPVIFGPFTQQSCEGTGVWGRWHCGSPRVGPGDEAVLSFLCVTAFTCVCIYGTERREGKVRSRPHMSASFSEYKPTAETGVDGDPRRRSIRSTATSYGTRFRHVSAVCSRNAGVSRVHRQAESVVRAVNNIFTLLLRVRACMTSPSSIHHLSIMHNEARGVVMPHLYVCVEGRDFRASVLHPIHGWRAGKTGSENWRTTSTRTAMIPSALSTANPREA